MKYILVLLVAIGCGPSPVPRTLPEESPAPACEDPDYALMWSFPMTIPWDGGIESVEMRFADPELCQHVQKIVEAQGQKAGITAIGVCR